MSTYILPTTINTLGEAQELFVRLEHQWVGWAFDNLPAGYRLRHGEGAINQLGADGKSGRRARAVISGTPIYVRDGVHMDGGTHYMKCGGDWELIEPTGELVSSSEDKVWVMLGTKWESLHPLCRWGGRFTPPDGNHISVFYNGKA